MCAGPDGMKGQPHGVRHPIRDGRHSVLESLTLESAPGFIFATEEPRSGATT